MAERLSRYSITESFQALQKENKIFKGKQVCQTQTAPKKKIHVTKPKVLSKIPKEIYNQGQKQSSIQHNTSKTDPTAFDPPNTGNHKLNSSE